MNFDFLARRPGKSFICSIGGSFIKHLRDSTEVTPSHSGKGMSTMYSQSSRVYRSSSHVDRYLWLAKGIAIGLVFLNCIHRDTKTKSRVIWKRRIVVINDW